MDAGSCRDAVGANVRVLIACEFSGTVRDQFRRLGHDAISCDILPTEVPGPHIQDDVLAVLNDGWDMMIGHPPCTYLANSGNKHLYMEDDREDKAQQAAVFFRKLLDASIPRIAIENPIMRDAVGRVGRKQDQVSQPYEYGHLETKATCLWLKGLPLLQPLTPQLKPVVQAMRLKDRSRIHYMSPGKDRWKERSRTYHGIAYALANQYGGHV
jgi:hypothetical protein